MLSINYSLKKKICFAIKKNANNFNRKKNRQISQWEFEFKEHFIGGSLPLTNPKTIFSYIHLIIPFVRVIIYCARNVGPWEIECLDSNRMKDRRRTNISSECLQLFSSFIWLQNLNGSCISNKMSCRIAFCLLLDHHH